MYDTFTKNLTSVSSYNTLLGTVDSIKITKPNENSVFRVVTYCPTSYAFTMASNAKFRIMSIPQYLSRLLPDPSRLRKMAGQHIPD